MRNVKRLEGFDSYVLVFNFQRALDESISTNAECGNKILHMSASNIPVRIKGIQKKTSRNG